MSSWRRDPLDDLLLPAQDLAERIKSGERRSSKPAEKLLAGALLVLLAERDSYSMLLESERSEAAGLRRYIELLKAEVPAAGLDRVNGHLRLHRAKAV